MGATCVILIGGFTGIRQGISSGWRTARGARAPGGPVARGRQKYKQGNKPKLNSCRYFGLIFVGRAF